MTRAPRRRLVVATPYWDYVLDQRPDSTGTLRDYHHVRSAHSVMVVPLQVGGGFLMVRQWRLPVRRFSLEFPGGGVAIGESVRAAARRELMEETGYDATSMIRLGRLHPCNGLSNEVCTVFLAEGLTVRQAHSDETEALEILTLGRSAVDQAFRANTPLDAVSMAAWHMLLGSKKGQGLGLAGN